MRVAGSPRAAMFLRRARSRGLAAGDRVRAERELARALRTDITWTSQLFCWPGEQRRHDPFQALRRRLTHWISCRTGSRGKLSDIGALRVNLRCSNPSCPHTFIETHGARVHAYTKRNTPQL